MCGDKGRLFVINRYNYVIISYLSSNLLQNFKKKNFLDLQRIVEKSVDNNNNIFFSIIRGF